MGRAVGGASAVGCGVVGLGGLLVGVGLTVWLGSMALSGSTGGGSDAAPVTVAVVPDEGAALVATPGDLVAGGTLTIRGTGFAAGPIELVACLTHPVAADSARCDPSTSAPVIVAADGTFERSAPVERVITVGGTDYDCAATAGGCSILGHRAENPPGSGPSAPITFRTGLPPLELEAPPQG